MHLHVACSCWPTHLASCEYLHSDRSSTLLPVPVCTDSDFIYDSDWTASLLWFIHLSCFRVWTDSASKKVLSVLTLSWLTTLIERHLSCNSYICLCLWKRQQTMPCGVKCLCSGLLACLAPIYQECLSLLAFPVSFVSMFLNKTSRSRGFRFQVRCGTGDEIHWEQFCQCHLFWPVRAVQTKATRQTLLQMTTSVFLHHLHK